MDELPQQEIIYVIVAGTMGMLLLVGSIAVFVAVYQKRILREQHKQKRLDEMYQLKMAELQLESQEEERKRLAADMHDSIGSLLWGVKLNASFLERSFDYDTEQRQSYVELMSALDTAISTVKRIAWELTPQAFLQEGFSESVARLCERMNGKKMHATFTQNPGPSWNDERALSAYRIVQELVSNCSRHAQCEHMSITLLWMDNAVAIAVEDDGVGFALTKERTGVGWWNINQRAKQLNATISIGDTPTPKGFRVVITVPLYQ
ncbi:MAG: hypothetical protein DI538_17675 [Azospira oryzae]|jgi:two-component system NarL family sensor kinase|nr:MAG: hypothetical protein DI538_17675 [Azospira oryzae]